MNFPKSKQCTGGLGPALQASKVNAMIVGPNFGFTKGPYKKQKKSWKSDKNELEGHTYMKLKL